MMKRMERGDERDRRGGWRFGRRGGVGGGLGGGFRAGGKGRGGRGEGGRARAWERACWVGGAGMWVVFVVGEAGGAGSRSRKKGEVRVGGGVMGGGSCRRGGVGRS